MYLESLNKTTKNENELVIIKQINIIKDVCVLNKFRIGRKRLKRVKLLKNPRQKE